MMGAGLGVVHDTCRTIQPMRSIRPARRCISTVAPKVSADMNACNRNPRSPRMQWRSKRRDSFMPLKIRSMDFRRL